MTREEYSSQYEKLQNKIDYVSRQYEDLLSLADDYIDSLEQRIAELEAPKTCDGCKFNYKIDNIDSQTGYRCDDIFPDECYQCSRNLNDRYEPKETK